MTQLLLKWFVSDYENVHDPNVRDAYGTLSGVVGILLNLLLSAGKFAAGVLTSSIAITADAINNLSDAGSSIVSLVGFKMAKEPAHKDHPFGHGRIEYIAGLIVSLIIILMGFELAKSSASKIFHPEPMQFSRLSLIILLCSIAVKLWMSVFNKRLGQLINSPTLRATATDSLSDTIATSVVVLCMIVHYFFQVNIDGIAGLIVACFILFAGYNTAKDTLSPLLGQPPDPEFVQAVNDMVLSHPDIIGIHDLIIHNYGPGRTMMSLHAEVPNEADVMQLHDTIDIIEHELKQKFRCDAVIHMDPILIDDTQTILMREKLAILVRSIDAGCTIHDFRMTKGPSHTNLIFDLVIPYQCPLSEEEAVRQVKEKVHQLDGHYYAVIQVDRNYANIPEA